GPRRPAAGRGVVRPRAVDRPRRLVLREGDRAIGREARGGQHLVRVNVIYNKIPHHAGRSGYDQVLRYLQRRVDVDNLPGDIPRLVPLRAMEWAARRASMEWYSAWSLALE